MDCRSLAQPAAAARPRPQPGQALAPGAGEEDASEEPLGELGDPSGGLEDPGDRADGSLGTLDDPSSDLGDLEGIDDLFEFVAALMGQIDQIAAAVNASMGQQGGARAAGAGGGGASSAAPAAVARAAGAGVPPGGAAGGGPFQVITAPVGVRLDEREPATAGSAGCPAPSSLVRALVAAAVLLAAL